MIVMNDCNEYIFIKHIVVDAHVKENHTDIEMEKIIHSGYGTVYLSGRFAVKCCAAASDEVVNLKYEYELLRSLAPHESIIKVYRFDEDDQLTTRITMERLDRTLRDLLFVLGPAGRAEKVAESLIRSIEYIHGRGIVHGDLKPDNMGFKLSNPNQVVLFDFGLAAECGEQQVCCGTYAYMPPEMLRSTKMLIARKETDMWSVGCILWEIFCGELLWRNDSRQSILTEIFTRQHVHLHPRIPLRWSVVIQLLLNTQWRLRPSAAALLSTPLFVNDKTLIGSSGSIPVLGGYHFARFGGPCYRM